jgi:HlyD family secretion protein
MFPFRQNPPPDDTALRHSIRMHMLVGAAIIAVLVGGIGGWAVFTEISGAVIARGTVVVESAVKHVQHREGGIVREIFVHDGDEVAAGDLLVRLDDTEERTRQSIIVSELAELHARRARLVAERDGAESIAFPERYEIEDAAAVEEIEARQTDLMRARKGSLSKRKQQLDEQVLQLEKQIGGLDAQQSATRSEIDLLDHELSGVQSLFDKQLITQDRVTALKRDKARLEGEESDLLSQAAGLHETISERHTQINQIEEESQAEILQELQDVSSRIAELELEKIAVEDALNRLQIRAPRSGYVHQLTAHTIGGVVHAGDTIMQIVPREDLLVIEAEVAPSDIDQLSVDQDAVIRFPGLDQRTTPRLAARVATIEASQTRYYEVRLDIPEEELARLHGQKLVPGMPVEAFITTTDRTVLAYLTKPITDQIAHALRES